MIFLGNPAVGKTSIVNRAIYDNVESEYEPTIAVDYFTKVVQVDGKSVSLQVMDTAGQEKFNSILPSYIRNAAVVVLVFDITSKPSFDELDKWYKLARGGTDGAVIVVGNKADLELSREVNGADAFKFSSSVGADFIETSTVTPINITELFDLIARTAIQTSEKIPNTQAVKLPKNSLPPDLTQTDSSPRIQSKCSC